MQKFVSNANKNKEHPDTNSFSKIKYSKPGLNIDETNSRHEVYWKIAMIWDIIAGWKLLGHLMDFLEGTWWKAWRGQTWIFQEWAVTHS